MSQDDITLYAFETPEGYFNMSPFCAKAELLLRLAGLNFRTEIWQDHKAFSKGKLPVLKDGEELIEDSEFIRLHIAKKYGETLDSTLTQEAIAIGHALIRMFEERTIFGLITGRWIDDAGWAITEEAFFGELPAGEREQVGTTIRNQNSEFLKGAGFGRHSRSEQITLLKADIAAAASLLGNRPWFFSEEPTYLDAAIFPQIANYYAAPIPTFMREIVGSHDNLVAYVERGLERWYPAAGFQTAAAE